MAFRPKFDCHKPLFVIERYLKRSLKISIENKVIKYEINQYDTGYKRKV